MFRWFENRIDPYPVAEPEHLPAGLLAFCIHYSRPIWKHLAIMSIITAIVSIIEVSLFSFMGRLVDWLAEADRATFLADEATTLIVMAVIIVVVLPALMFFNGLFLFQVLIGNFPMIVRWKAHRYLLGQSLGFFQDEFAGRIATKVMQTSLAVREAVMKVLDVLLYVAVYFTGMLVIVASADLRLMLPLAVWLVVYLCALRFFVPRLRDIAKEQADARSIMTGRVVDSYTNIQTVKLFAHANREIGYAREGMDGFLDTVHRQMRLVTLFYTMLYVMNSALLFAVASISIWLWMHELVGLGAIAIAISMVLRLGSMSQWIMWEVSALFENIGTIQDGINTLSRPRDVMDVSDAPALEIDAGEIEFDKIRFHYGKEGGVIEDLSLVVRPGEKVGLVGRSGAGKSTLVNLLLRFYDIEGGTIRIDGQDIAAMTQDSLRAQIGMVTQDTSLLHRSVRDNILYGRPAASEEEMIDAARQAEAMEFIADLEDPKGRQGFDAHVGERGVKLSGGQRQRIAIARVLLKDAPILLLDEATSALDSEVETAIQHSLTGFRRLRPWTGLSCWIRGASWNKAATTSSSARAVIMPVFGSANQAVSSTPCRRRSRRRRFADCRCCLTPPCRCAAARPRVRAAAAPS